MTPIRYASAAALLLAALAPLPAAAQNTPDQARKAAWSACLNVTGGAGPLAVQTQLRSAGFSFNPVPGFTTGQRWSSGGNAVTIGYAFAGGLQEAEDCEVTVTGPAFTEAALTTAARDLAAGAEAREETGSRHIFRAYWEEAYEVITLDPAPGGGWRFRIGVPAGGWREGAGS